MLRKKFVRYDDINRTYNDVLVTNQKLYKFLKCTFFLEMLIDPQLKTMV